MLHVKLIVNFVSLLAGAEQVVYSQFLVGFCWKQLPSVAEDKQDLLKVNQNSDVAGQKTKILSLNKLFRAEQIYSRNSSQWVHQQVVMWSVINIFRKSFFKWFCLCWDYMWATNVLFS